MRNSSAANSVASSPPVPARISSTTLRAALASLVVSSCRISSSRVARSAPRRSCSSCASAYISSLLARPASISVVSACWRRRAVWRWYSSTTCLISASALFVSAYDLWSVRIAGSASLWVSSWWVFSSCASFSIIMDGGLPRASGPGREGGGRGSERRHGIRSDRGGGRAGGRRRRGFRQQPVLAQRLDQGDDGDLEHVVGRLLGGDLLQHEPGEDQRGEQRRRPPARGQAEHLIGDSGDQRHEQQPGAARDHERRRLRGEREGPDREQQDEQQEARAAARMQAALRARALD